MCSSRAGVRLCHNGRLKLTFRSAYSTTSYSTPAPNPTRITDADVTEARSYCSNLLAKFDSPSFTLQTFIPPSTRDTYLAIRALNVELARIPDVVSNPTVGALRMQFWRDNLTRTFANTPPKEPVAILLHNALSSLQVKDAGLSTTTMKTWCMKIIGAREQYMDNRPYVTLEALESYAENTYSTLMYLTLAALPMHSLSVDHLASHIGKATGIAAVLRGLPLIAFPPPPNHHSNRAGLGTSLAGDSNAKQGAVLLPLDIMAEMGVKQEEVLRHGAEAPGLRDAIFKVATRANDHLITAKEMLKNLQQGKSAGHDFEHEGEEGHDYPQSDTKGDRAKQDIDRGFGVLLPAVATKLWLERLERADFDVFRPELRTREWKLPWKAYWAYSRKSL